MFCQQNHHALHTAHHIYSHYYRFAFNSPFVRNTGTFTVGYRILLKRDTGYFHRGIKDTFTGGYRILLQGDTGYFYRGIQDTFTVGYRIRLQGDTGYFYRVIQDALSG